ncbi:unnamed protein product [Brachionus calyciflorus]|uniref:Uncharacterized protein n=1 Tax=Brachionus calyciflorus TaxID=104777 RepID=A0A814QGW7_9BILA|nr:unnamed protein product [Brachionus calyciflorus]
MIKLLEFISILETIHTTIVNILRDLQMFNPDPTSKRLSALLELMEELSSLNEFLNRTSSISVNDSIRIHIKIGLENLYQKTKNQILSQTISEDPLNNKKFDSNTVYSMLVFCRDQITYYKNIVSQKTFKNMNILNLVFDVVYENLMNDVKSLFEEHFDELYDQSKLNLNLLALAYRLNQFDTEFIEHVPME